ncbi:MAG: type IV toxin-antitoxin system AbiEi family antitoxin domain-containing protein [Planctomycetota bacterium]
MAFKELLNQKPVLTHEEVTAFLEKERPRKARTRDSLLAYYLRTQRLVRIRRGLYAVVPLGAAPETFHVDPHLVAAQSAPDATLGYHSALEFHGKAHAPFHEFYFLTAKQRRPFSFRSYRFRPILFPKALRDRRKVHYATKSVPRDGVTVRVCTLERTLVDLLDRPDLAGGWEELWHSVTSIEFFDLDEVVSYALLLDNATTAAKVGFFLEQQRERLMVEESHLGRLQEHRPRQPHYLDRDDRTGRLLPQWNLIVPKVVLDSSWSEGT